LQIKYPHVISNKELYKRTKELAWHKRIKVRRMRFLGHVMRLHEDTPARQELKEATYSTKKQKQGNNRTWVKQVNKDLADLKLSLNDADLVTLVGDRGLWDRKVVKGTLQCLQETE
jgi:hypothetical protein